MFFAGKGTCFGFLQAKEDDLQHLDMSEREVVMLEIQELTKKYGKYLAVDHVSFTVPTGQVGILLGPNGAGKSTIIKSIAGLPGRRWDRAYACKDIGSQASVCLCARSASHVRRADSTGTYRIY